MVFPAQLLRRLPIARWLSLPALALLVLPLSLAAQTAEQIERLFYRPALPGAPAPDLPQPWRLPDDPLLPPDTFWMTPADGRPAAELMEALAAEERRVLAIEQAEGALSAALIEPLMEQAELLRMAERHEEAIALLERVQHLQRVNYGLETARQLSAIEGRVANLLASGRYAEADQAYTALYRRQFSSPAEDTEVVDRMLSYAGFQLSYFERELEQGPPRERIEGMTRNELVGRVFSRLQRARRAYEGALGVLLRQGRLNDPRLPSLQRRLLEIDTAMTYSSQIDEDLHNYRYVNRRPSRRRPGGGYHHFQGRLVYQRMLSLQWLQADNSVADKVETLLQTADWGLFWYRYSDARKGYRSAWQLVSDAGLPAAQAGELLRSPVPVEVPVIQPAFLPGLHPSPPQWRGYVDVSLRLNKYGRAKDVEILDRSAEHDERVADKLRIQLRRARFRPHIEAGEAVNSPTLTVRYHYAW